MVNDSYPVGRLVVLLEHPDGGMVAMDGIASAEVSVDHSELYGLSGAVRPRKQTTLTAKFSDEHPIRWYRQSEPIPPDTAEIAAAPKQVEP